MELNDLYLKLSKSYIRIEPHHTTWMLWLKQKSKEELFEVAVGTILVQNTNWKNVDLAISNLFEKNIRSFRSLKATEPVHLEEIIRPAGFYKQKARSLYSLADVFLDYSDDPLKFPSREELLNIKGVGKETADSLLVYCFYRAVPIVGTYTRRFFTRISGEIHYLTTKYENIQRIILDSLSSDYHALGKFHALIVSHSQQLCQKIGPLCVECMLKSHCVYGTYHDSDSNLLRLQETILKPKTTKRVSKS